MRVYFGFARVEFQIDPSFVCVPIYRWNCSSPCKEIALLRMVWNQCTVTKEVKHRYLKYHLHMINIMLLRLLMLIVNRCLSQHTAVKLHITIARLEYLALRLQCALTMLFYFIRVWIQIKEQSIHTWMWLRAIMCFIIANSCFIFGDKVSIFCNNSWWDRLNAKAFLK